MKSIIVLLLLINSSLQEESIPGNCGEKLAIQPEGEELILSSGFNFSLTCSIKRNGQNLTWFKLNEKDKELFSVRRFFNGNCSVEKLYVINASVYHTGYYICKIPRRDSSFLEQRSEIYVYVSDKKRLLVPLLGRESTVIASHKSMKVVMPCRPTHPHIQVKLFKRDFGSSEEQQVYPSQNSRWKFEPRNGFLLDRPLPDDGGDFRCVATHNETEEETKLELLVAESFEIGFSILPDNEERIFPSGSSFSFMCSYCRSDITSLSWSYPNKEDAKRFQDRHFSDRGCIFAKLNVFNASVQDTGNFTCQKEDNMDAKIYVYVSDEKSLFVPFLGSYEMNSFLGAYEYDKIALRCRLTHPSIEVTLFQPLVGRPEIQVYPSNDSRWKFDPRKGFLLDKVSFDDDGWFKCVATHNGTKDELELSLRVTPSLSPHIDRSGAVNVSLGNPFQLSCSFSYDSIFKEIPEFQWIIPDENGIRENRIQIRKEKKSNVEFTTAYSNLTVTESQLKDEGNYTCLVNNRTASVFILIGKLGTGAENPLICGVGIPVLVVMLVVLVALVIYLGVSKVLKRDGI